MHPHTKDVRRVILQTSFNCIVLLGGQRQWRAYEKQICIRSLAGTQPPTFIAAFFL